VRPLLKATDRVRPLLKATFWAWLVRMNVAGLIVGLLIK